MSRQAITPKLLAERRAIGRRMRALRRLIHGGPEQGPGGLNEMSAAVACRRSTYEKYERGVCCPAEVVLRLIAQYDVSPFWLLAGHGPIFNRRPSAPGAVNGGGGLAGWDD